MSHTVRGRNAQHLMIAFGFAISMLVLDLVTKELAESKLADASQAVEVLPFFRLVLSYNTGISFGLFQSGQPYAPYLLAALAAAIVLAVAVWLWRSDSLVQRMGLAAIAGGGASNLLDRLHDGAVTDFLDLYVGAYHWPAFNLADAAIVFGVAVLLFHSVRSRPTASHSE